MHVIDKRHISTAEACFQSIVEHVREAVTDGVIKTVITLFPPVQPNQTPVRIWNAQVFAYAGYEDGLGDPAQKEFTQCLIAKGWVPPIQRSNWDILPIAIQASDKDVVELFTLPKDIIHEVHINSASYPKINKLELRWFAVPLISGVYYPCCPFNGWFMETEVVRDLADVQSLWKDECQMILAKAVLESFMKSNYSMVDHHSASDAFIRFYGKEMETRGYCPADWGWIVPPMGGGTTKVFHQEMLNYQLKPMYRLQPQSHKIYKFGNQMLIRSNIETVEDGLMLESNFNRTINKGECDMEKVKDEMKTNTRLVDTIGKNNARKSLILFASETGNNN
eukprot:Pgem_evm1s162